MLSYLLWQLVQIASGIAVPTVSYLGIRYLNKRWNLRISQEETDMLSNVGLRGVTFVEQSLKNAPKGKETNKTKRDLAMKFIMRDAGRRGISIDKETAEGLVEIAVFRMNHETLQLNSAEE